MTELDLPEDYQDLLREFVEAEVEFLLIGGWAVAVHGHGRATDDIDLFVRPDPGNATKVYAALDRYGAPLGMHGVTEELFAGGQHGYRLGRKPLMIEILTGIDGVSFDDAMEGAVRVLVGGMEIPVIGRKGLLANKRASARPKDLADVQALAGDED